MSDDLQLISEKRLLALCPGAEFKAPPEFIRFFEELVPSLLFPPEILDIFEGSDNVNTQTENLLAAFKLFPVDFPKFIHLVEIIRSLEKGALTNDAVIRSYGIANTRNFILALALVNLSKKSKFEWDPATQRPKVPSTKIVQYGPKVEAGYSGRAMNLAFMAGFIFDALAAVAQKILPSPLKVLNFIEQTVNHDIRTAQIGLEISKKTNDLKLAHYVYSACMLRGVGRVVMAIFDDSYINFYSKMSKDDLPYSAQLLCEEYYYGASSDIYGAWICENVPTFAPIRDAILYQRQPFVLKNRSEHDLHKVAMVSSLAWNISHIYCRMMGPEDPLILEKWLRTEVRDLGLSSSTIYTVVTEEARQIRTS